MNNYALTIILKADLDEKDRKGLLDSVTKKFEKLDKEDIWGARDMAYQIKRQSKGYYAHYLFSAEPATAVSLDKELKMNEDILRYLLVRV